MSVIYFRELKLVKTDNYVVTLIINRAANFNLHLFRFRRCQFSAGAAPAAAVEVVKEEDPPMIWDSVCLI